MARTLAGRRLTDAHRKAQVKLAGIAAALTVQNAKRLDLNDLDGTRADWERRQVLIIEAMRGRSQALAREYLAAYWEAEGMEPDDITDDLDLTPAREAVAWVVPTIKARVARYGDGG